MAGKGSAPGERRGGRAPGVPNQLPDLRRMTLAALRKAGGVEYLERQAHQEPVAFLGLLGKVMPREVHQEITAEVRARLDVRRDLVEKLCVLLATPSVAPIEHETPSAPLPAIAHTPDVMLKAQALSERTSESRASENARKDGMAVTLGAVQRAASMHLERSQASNAKDRMRESAPHHGERPADSGGNGDGAQSAGYPVPARVDAYA